MGWVSGTLKFLMCYGFKVQILVFLVNKSRDRGTGAASIVMCEKLFTVKLCTLNKSIWTMQHCSHIDDINSSTGLHQLLMCEYVTRHGTLSKLKTGL